MRLAIQLDDEPGANAGEIRNVWRLRVLLAELRIEYLPPAQPLPQDCFGLGELAAQFLRLSARFEMFTQWRLPLRQALRACHLPRYVVEDIPRQALRT